MGTKFGTPRTPADHSLVPLKHTNNRTHEYKVVKENMIYLEYKSMKQLVITNKLQQPIYLKMKIFNSTVEVPLKTAT